MESIFNNQSQEVTLLNRIKSIYFLYFDHKKRLETYSNEFNIFMNEYLTKNNITLNEIRDETQQEKETADIPVETQQEKNEKQNDIHETSTLYKKLYRTISLQCHPDKTKDKDKIDIFNMIKHHYKENDCVAMSLIAINKGMMEKSNLQLMENDINEKVEQLYSKINDMKLTYAWIFKFSSEADRIELIKKIIKSINSTSEVMSDELTQNSDVIHEELTTDFFKSAEYEMFEPMEEMLEDELKRDIIDLDYEIDNLNSKLKRLELLFEKNIEQIKNYNEKLENTTSLIYNLQNINI
jgi:hypothetical protein